MSGDEQKKQSEMTAELEEEYINQFAAEMQQLIAASRGASPGEAPGGREASDPVGRRSGGPAGSPPRAIGPTPRAMFWPAVRVAAVLLIGIGIGWTMQALSEMQSLSELRGLRAEMRATRREGEVRLALQKAQLVLALGLGDQVEEAKVGLRTVTAEIRRDQDFWQTRACALDQLGSALFLLREYEHAQWVWELAVSRGTRSGELFMGLANCQKVRRRWEQCAQTLRVVLKQPFSPEDRARAANLLAYVLFEQAGDRDGAQRTALLAEARQRAEQALALVKGKYAKACVNLGMILKLQDRPDEARTALEKGKALAQEKLAKFRDSPRLLFTLAIISARLEQTDEAYAFLGKAIRAESRDFPPSFWARDEPAFAEAKMNTTGRFDKLLNESTLKWNMPATMQMVWDEDFEPSSKKADNPALLGPPVSREPSDELDT